MNRSLVIRVALDVMELNGETDRDEKRLEKRLNLEDSVAFRKERLDGGEIHA